MFLTRVSYDDGDFREEVPLREVRPAAGQAPWGGNSFGSNDSRNNHSSSSSSLAGIAGGGVSGAEAAALRAELAQYKTKVAELGLAQRNAEQALQRAEAGQRAAESREAHALAQGLAGVQQVSALEAALATKEQEVQAAQQAAMQVKQTCNSLCNCFVGDSSILKSPSIVLSGHPLVLHSCLSSPPPNTLIWGHFNDLQAHQKASSVQAQAEAAAAVAKATASRAAAASQQQRSRPPSPAHGSTTVGPSQRSGPLTAADLAAIALEAASATAAAAAQSNGQLDGRQAPLSAAATAAAAVKLAGSAWELLRAQCEAELNERLLSASSQEPISHSLPADAPPSSSDAATAPPVSRSLVQGMVSQHASSSLYTAAAGPGTGGRSNSPLMRRSNRSASPGATNNANPSGHSSNNCSRERLTEGSAGAGTANTVESQQRGYLANVQSSNRRSNFADVLTKKSSGPTNSHNDSSAMHNAASSQGGSNGPQRSHSSGSVVSGSTATHTQSSSAPGQLVGADTENAAVADRIAAWKVNPAANASQGRHSTPQRANTSGNNSSNNTSSASPRRAASPLRSPKPPPPARSPPTELLKDAHHRDSTAETTSEQGISENTSTDVGNHSKSASSNGPASPTSPRKSSAEALARMREEADASASLAASRSQAMLGGRGRAPSPVPLPAGKAAASSSSSSSSSSNESSVTSPGRPLTPSKKNVAFSSPVEMGSPNSDSEGQNNAPENLSSSSAPTAAADEGDKAARPTSFSSVSAATASASRAQALIARAAGSDAASPPAVPSSSTAEATAVRPPSPTMNPPSSASSAADASSSETGGAAASSARAAALIARAGRNSENSAQPPPQSQPSEEEQGVDATTTEEAGTAEESATTGEKGASASGGAGGASPGSSGGSERRRGASPIADRVKMWKRATGRFSPLPPGASPNDNKRTSLAGEKASPQRSLSASAVRELAEKAATSPSKPASPGRRPPHPGRASPVPGTLAHKNAAAAAAAAVSGDKAAADSSTSEASSRSSERTETSPGAADASAAEVKDGKDAAAAADNHTTAETDAAGNTNSGSKDDKGSTGARGQRRAQSPLIARKLAVWKNGGEKAEAEKASKEKADNEKADQAQAAKASKKTAGKSVSNEGADAKSDSAADADAVAVVAAGDPSATTEASAAAPTSNIRDRARNGWLGSSGSGGGSTPPRQGGASPRAPSPGRAAARATSPVSERVKKWKESTAAPSERSSPGNDVTGNSGSINAASRLTSSRSDSRSPLRNLARSSSPARSSSNGHGAATNNTGANSRSGSTEREANALLVRRSISPFRAAAEREATAARAAAAAAQAASANAALEAERKAAAAAADRAATSSANKNAGSKHKPSNSSRGQEDSNTTNSSSVTVTTGTGEFGNGLAQDQSFVEPAKVLSVGSRVFALFDDASHYYPAVVASITGGMVRVSSSAFTTFPLTFRCACIK